MYHCYEYLKYKRFTSSKRFVLPFWFSKFSLIDFEAPNKLTLDQKVRCTNLVLTRKMKPEKVSGRKSSLFVSALEEKSREVVHLGTRVDREHLVHHAKHLKRSPVVIWKRNNQFAFLIWPLKFICNLQKLLH